MFSISRFKAPRIAAMTTRLSVVNMSTSIPLTSGKLNVDFYFDTVSPYSWPAFEVLCRYKERWDMNIVWKPVYLAGLTKAASNPYLNSMTECPNKAGYSFMDLETRTAKYFNIPLKMKEDPFTLIAVVGSLQQQRFTTAVLQTEPDLLEPLLRSFWVRCWGEDSPVHTVEDITKVARNTGMGEVEIQEALQNMKSDSVKTALKDVTEDAVERGAFGAPTMFFSQDCDNEQMIWGSDRFEMVAHLYKKPWLGPDPDSLERVSS